MATPTDQAWSDAAQIVADAELTSADFSPAELAQIHEAHVEAGEVPTPPRDPAPWAVGPFPPPSATYAEVQAWYAANAPPPEPAHEAPAVENGPSLVCNACMAQIAGAT